MAHDPIDVEVGINIRQARNAVGVSQSDLAKALGMTFQQVQKYEKGTNRVSVATLVRTARTLGVSASTLLPPDGPAIHSPAMLNTLSATRGADILVEAFSRIPNAKTRRIVLDLVATLATTVAHDDKVEA